MTDHDALLAAIIANPDDDTVRLVYADWLDENGQGERAEFIRVQVALSTPTLGADGTGDSQKRHELVRREAAIMSRRGPVEGRGKWWADYGPGDRVSVVEWLRGFVSEVTCTLADWLAHGPAIVAAHPIRRVVLTDIVVSAAKSLFRGTGTDDRDYGGIPAWLWDRIRAMKRHNQIDGCWMYFDTRELAIDVLSDACLLHAKRKDKVTT